MLIHSMHMLTHSYICSCTQYIISHSMISQYMMEQGASSTQTTCTSKLSILPSHKIKNENVTAHQGIPSDDYISANQIFIIHYGVRWSHLELKHGPND